jgi:hypothetical protein
MEFIFRGGDTLLVIPGPAGCIQAAEVDENRQQDSA